MCLVWFAFAFCGSSLFTFGISLATSLVLLLLLSLLCCGYGMTNFLGLEKNYIDGILCPCCFCWVCWWLKLLWLISSRLGWLKLLDITIYLLVLLIVNSEFWSKLLISRFLAYLGCLDLVGFMLSLNFLAPTPTQLHTSLLLELLVSLSINFCMSHVSNMVDDWCRWGSFISNVFGNDDWCR